MMCKRGIYIRYTHRQGEALMPVPVKYLGLRAYYIL